MSNGIQVTQEGISVEKASDYQKVLDSRWLFMEVGLEIDTTINVPTLGTMTELGYQRVNIARHGQTRQSKPYIPAFHGSYKIRESYDPFLFNGGLAIDDTWIYFWRRYTNGDTTPAYTVEVKAKIYTLPILQEYLAITEIAPRSVKSASKYGLRALDGSDSAVDIGDTSSHGFSIDTRKKILSVHKVTRKKINYSFYNSASVTAINTTTNVLTIDVDPDGIAPDGGQQTGITWIETGKQIQYFPDDLSTYPNPLSFAVSPFIIKVDPTHIQLALAAADAAAGNAIDLTTAGSLPGFIREVGGPDEERVLHENDYPPSYMFCDVIQNVRGAGEAATSLKFFSTTPLVLADSRYLYFRGVQAIYIGDIALIILKDPIEVAG